MSDPLRKKTIIVTLCADFSIRFCNGPLTAGSNEAGEKNIAPDAKEEIKLAPMSDPRSRLIFDLWPEFE
jgi:hypothetical protein